MNFHNAFQSLPAARFLLCAGLLGGLALFGLPSFSHAQQTGQEIVREQAETNEQLIGAALGEGSTAIGLNSDTTGTITNETGATTGTEDSTTSSGRVSIPETPEPGEIGESVRTAVRGNLRSRCSQRCGNVLQSSLRTCDLSPAPQECANRAQSKFRLCRAQCN